MFDEYSRERLIELCESAIRNEAVWSNRDSQSAHVQLGTAWALLKAGCTFQVITGKGPGPVTDGDTVWVRVFSEGFQFHETRDDGDKIEDFFYIPTQARQNRAGDEDWY